MDAQHVFIGIGASIGDRVCSLSLAFNALIQNSDIKVIKISSVYESEPWGGVAVSSFLNAVIWCITSLDAKSCLEFCKTVEIQLGREKEKRWADRLIDLDVLIYGEKIIHSDRLILPHPRMLERNFVLVPFNEIASNVIVPGTNQKISEHLRNCTDQSAVEYYSKYPTTGEAS